jgi:hypothetical protein
MVMTTIRLGETMQNANIESMVALCSSDERAVEKQGELLKNYDKEFRENLALLPPILEKADIPFESRALDNTQQAFFLQAGEMIAAQRKKTFVKSASLDAFENQRKTLDTELNKLVHRALEAVNEKEDRGRTLIQAGDASMGKMEEMLAELFGQDLALLQGGVTLKRYLMNLQDLSRAFTTESDNEELASIEKNLQRRRKNFNPD